MAALDQILDITNDTRWFDSPCAREIRRVIEEARRGRPSIDVGALSNEIRARSIALRNAPNGDGPLTVGVLCDDGELLTVLARIVEGMPMERAFGRPGDWGYEHPIGRALKGGQ